MSDTRELLRRGLGDYRPEPDGFESVLRRRDRKRRNRRVGAGLVAVAILAIGAYLFASQFRTDTIPGGPNTAPSSGWIVFSATSLDRGGLVTRNSPRDLYVVREGVEPRVIVGTTGDHIDQFCPSISPDGARLAYIAQGDGNAQLVIAPLETDGSVGTPAIEQVVRPGYSLNPCPRWTLDGERVAVIDAGSVLTIGANGSASTFEGITGVDDLAWSPDGKQVAIRQGSTVSVIGDGPPREVAIGLGGEDGNQLAWSSNGIAIGASEPAGGGNPSKAETFIRIVDPSSGDSRDVALGPHGWVDGVTWLPDGRILFTDGSFAAKVVDPAATGGPTVLGSGVSRAVLSPDGRSVVWVGFYDDAAAGGYAVFTMPLDGGPAKQLTPYAWGAEYADFDW